MLDNREDHLAPAAAAALLALSLTAHFHLGSFLPAIESPADGYADVHALPLSPSLQFIIIRQQRRLYRTKNQRAAFSLRATIQRSHCSKHYSTIGAVAGGG